MRRVVRFCVTAGIAVAGASVFAAAPVTPSLPDVQVPAVQLSNDTAPETQGFLDLWQTATGDSVEAYVEEMNTGWVFGDLVGSDNAVVAPNATVWQDILDRATPDLKSEIQTDPTPILQSAP